MDSPLSSSFPILPIIVDMSGFQRAYRDSQGAGLPTAHFLSARWLIPAAVLFCFKQRKCQNDLAPLKKSGKDVKNMTFFPACWFYQLPIRQQTLYYFN
jgi:hypothetical protein